MPINKLKIWSKYLLTISFIIPASITFSQIPSVTTGEIKRIDNFTSAYVQPHTVDIWLPNLYNPSKKYRVLYMQDGRSLFDSTIMWNHQEWKVDETVQQLLNTKKISECIVVGIWNADSLRHNEYMPQKPFNQLSPHQKEIIYTSKRSNGQLVFKSKEIQSDNYLKFIVKELKPFIDSSFSTFKDKAHTFIAGSSMGGLISLYAICEYPEIFGGAACLSTHWTGIFTEKNNPIPAVIMQYLKSHLPKPANHKLYFDYGTATLDTLYKPFQLQANKILKTNGYTKNNLKVEEFAGADHSEKAWSERLYIPLLFLLKKQKDK